MRAENDRILVDGHYIIDDNAPNIPNTRNNRRIHHFVIPAKAGIQWV